MGLNCGCPAGPYLGDLDIMDCKESLGQVQKVIFQRIYNTDGSLNTIASPTAKANYSALLTSKTGDRITVSPYLQGPTTEPGAARTFGGGNQTLGGVEIIIGREPTTFAATMYQESQLTIKQLKSYMCENVGVYLVDENGNIAGLYPDSIEDGDGSEIAPIPIGKLFIGDKKLGGFEEPDSNTIEWSFFPNWSDNLYILKREELDFNPLTDLVNAAAKA